MDNKDAIIEQLKNQVSILIEQNKMLEKENQLLREEIARLKKNSGNSSKPPSSDIVRPTSKTRCVQSKRKRGAQRGHKKHNRIKFTPEQVDQRIEYELKGKDAEGLIALDQWLVVQQVNLPKKLYTVTEHCGRKYLNPKNGKIIIAPLPPQVAQGRLFGADITSLSAYMKGACHMSYSTIRQLFNDIFGINVSRGLLCKTVNKVSNALEQSHTQLAQRIPNEPSLGIDETGHKDEGKKHWTWCFQTKDFTFFHINKSRGSKVLFDILGKEFSGIIGCDYWGGYRKYSRLTDTFVQFCMAHLIREIKFLAKYPVIDVSQWANKLLDFLKKLFETMRNAEKLTAKYFASRMQKIKDGFLTEVRRPPDDNVAKKISRRFKGEAAESYFRFLTAPDVEPTNNGSEREIRHTVIDRKITQGTRGDSGMRWCERIWSTIATCKKQNRDVFEFIHKSILAHWNNNPLPSLL